MTVAVGGEWGHRVLGGFQRDVEGVGDEGVLHVARVGVTCDQPKKKTQKKLPEIKSIGNK
jgi:hypothetical protein